LVVNDIVLSVKFLEGMSNAMLIWIAVANAVLWSGVIIFLLLSLVRSSLEIEAQAVRVEAQLSQKTQS
jgi:hypothetical protein